MLGVSYSFRFERALAGGLTLGLLLGMAVWRGTARPCPWVEEQRVHAIEAKEAAQAAVDRAEPRARADELYRAKQFDAAADVIAAVRPSDVDLQNLALQYQRLSRAWVIGMNPESPVTDAFHALREAWKLDTVLGGVHNEEIQQRLTDIALIAGQAFELQHDALNADLANHTADVLGR